MAELQKLPDVAGTGIKSISDLYDLINGTTTTQSGGTSTTTTNSGISQDSMNSMLQSILEGNQGLAAVSSGQRAAGGYGSSINTMLTNDLLTRAASQVAQQNKTSTVTTTQPPVTKTVGGISPAGVSKTGGVLALLAGGSKLTKGSDILNSMYKLLGFSGSSSGSNSTPGADIGAITGVAGPENTSSQNLFAGSNPSDYGNFMGSGTSYDASSSEGTNSLFSGFDTSNDMANSTPEDTSSPVETAANP